MIINFKTFENKSRFTINNNKYWFVKYDNFLYVKLYKIGMSFDIIEMFSFLHNYQKDTFIGYTVDDPKHGTYYSYSYANRTADQTVPGWDKDYYSNNGYEYMGEVEITEDDIKNYEIEKNANKYNL